MPWETPGRPRTLLVPTPVPPGTAFRRLRSSNPQAGGRPSGEGPRPGLPFPPTEGTNRDGEGPNLPGGDGGGRERPRGGERGQSPTQGLTTRERRANDRTLTRAGGGRPRGPHSPRSGGPPPSPRRCGPRPPPTPDPGAEGDVGRVAGTAGSLDARVSQKGLFSSGCLCSLDGAREDAPPQPQELPAGVARAGPLRLSWAWAAGVNRRAAPRSSTWLCLKSRLSSSPFYR